MKKFVINGGRKLSGEIKISGSKNVATKAVIAACLTSEPVVLKNIPQISDIDALLSVIESLGGTVAREGHTVTITVKEIKKPMISLAEGARVRTSSMFISPLLLRCKKAVVPNPEGCRIGARPIERHIEALEKMGARIEYKSEDGYYHATTNGLKGTTYKFSKNTHTGTETLIMAAVLADGTTTIENAAEEHEIDDLISLLNKMGAKIKRSDGRVIIVEGVEKLHGATHEIVCDSNELVTFAVLSMLAGGNILLTNAKLNNISVFLDEVRKAGGAWEENEEGVRFFVKDGIKPSDIVTASEPGFKTDWQGAWAIFMTQADGESTIHETIYENRFGYVSELRKMGAKIDYFEPDAVDPESLYNFNYEKGKHYQQGIRIIGPINLHNAVLVISDLRAGATIVIASLLATGESVLTGVEHIDRGYENFAQRLREIGANIEEVEDKY